MNKEKVRELVKDLDFSYGKLREEIITEWLEQNKPEPVVVGLSDEQIISMADFVSNQWTGNRDILDMMKEWQKTQTFAQPENTKLEKEIAEMQISYIDLQRYCSELKSELEQLKSQQFQPNAPISIIREVVLNGVRYREI